MRVLVTGNLGYIGSVLVPILQDLGNSVTGYDIGFFDDCLLYETTPPNTQIRGDVRDISKEQLAGIDAIIHLAGLSNDPLGEFSPKLTEDINYSATVRLCRLARETGVSRFVYASSQSMYGISNSDSELDEDNSDKNPITAYARTKWKAECEINQLADDNFTVVSFRPSTVFGASPRLRSDIVYNNFVGCAFTTGLIEIKSDGTPCRPVVHIQDVCSAFIAGLNAPTELINKRSFNVGIPNGNFTVRDLAEAANNAVPNSRLVFTGQHGKDSRTYRVSFQRILHELKDWYSPQWDLISGASELVTLYARIGFTEELFRGPMTNRLCKLKLLCDMSVLDNQLRFK